MRFFRSKPARDSRAAEPVPRPGQETQRLAAVRQLRLLDTAREERFDRFTRLAAAALQMPVALLSLVDEQREWFKSALGLQSLREVPRTNSFASAVLGAEGRNLIVRDAAKDRRFESHPLVAGPDGLRFYAGQSLYNGDGVRIGVLAVMDRKPRDFGPAQEQVLNDLGLLAEEYDTRARRMVGNFPQAFSHVALINSAHNLSAVHGPAEERATRSQERYR